MKKENYFRYYIGQKVKWIEGTTVTLTVDLFANIEKEEVWDDFTLLLRPLSTLTEEEAKELVRLVDPAIVEITRIQEVEIGYLTPYGNPDDERYEWIGMQMETFTPAQFHFLLSKGFDLFGIGDNN